MQGQGYGTVTESSHGWVPTGNITFAQPMGRHCSVTAVLFAGVFSTSIPPGQTEEKEPLQAQRRSARQGKPIQRLLEDHLMAITHKYLVASQTVHVT